MSSTNRGMVRDNDYYKTPVDIIVHFLEKLKSDCDFNLNEGSFILDPCAGGIKDKENMSYPEALLKAFPDVCLNLETMDIREDSPAKTIGDYLQIDCKDKYDVIITNPPFIKAQEIITKAFDDVKAGGLVIMLLRLNFFGSQSRFEFWEKYMPDITFVHSKRISFTGGPTDSIEYMHAVWRKTGKDRSPYTLLRVI